MEKEYCLGKVGILLLTNPYGVTIQKKSTLFKQNWDRYFEIFHDTELERLMKTLEAGTASFPLRPVLINVVHYKLKISFIESLKF